MSRGKATLCDPCGNPVPSWNPERREQSTAHTSGWRLRWSPHTWAAAGHGGQGTGDATRCPEAGRGPGAAPRLGEQEGVNGQRRLSLTLSTDHTGLTKLPLGFLQWGNCHLGVGQGQVEGLGATSQGWVCLDVAVWLFCQGTLPVK